MSLRPRQSPAKRRKMPTNSTTPRPNRTRLPSYLKPGAAVEISPDESGFRGAWFAGKVVSVPSSGSGRVEVEYVELFIDEGHKIRSKELVDVNDLRPQPPAMTEKEKKGIVVGTEVDAFYGDGWWEGVVTEVLGNGRFSVFFRGSREQIRFKRDEIRIHREWVNGAWKPPLEGTVEEESEEEEDTGDDTEEEEDLLSRVDPETARAFAKQMFTSGTSIEVSSDEEGFKGSWFVAKVVERIDEDKFLVEYRDLREENGVEPLKEEAHFLHIRPPPPPPSEEERDFSVGDKIDAFYNDGWWVGDVTESSSRDGIVGVLFKQSGERMRFGRQGLRLHKEWVNGTWQLPLKKGEIRSEKKVGGTWMTPTKSVDKQEFSIGTLVEVNSEEEGFEDSWFRAKLIEYRGKDKCLVEYDDLKAEDGKETLREELNAWQIRPRPLERIVVNPFERHDKVDALYNDGRWVGVIVKVLAKSCYLVKFKKTDEVLKFHHSELRPHQDWIDGKWVPSS